MLDENLAHASQPPTLKGGRYIVAGVLGKGGNAGVYQAWDTQLRQWRAIKVLAHEFIKDDEVRARFAQEAATMARLEHPNLVRVFDISDDAYTPHIVMEICSGGSVIQWMKTHGAVPPRLALFIAESTALGVQCAHADGIIHRDVKPQNILITRKGVIKLTDFGIARNEDNSLTQAGATIGTYAFMAPEQRHDSTMVDERADVYSLGATLFTMLQVKTTTELFVADRGDEILEGIPEPILDLILTACSYKPKNRYADIETFLEALRAARELLPEDPPHPPLEANALSLPNEPPETLPDFSKLEDLLKSLALHDDTPTYMERPDNTTLGSSTPDDTGNRAMPYMMPSSDSTREAPEPGARPSYIDETEYEKVEKPATIPPETPAPAPVTQVEAAEPVPPHQNPLVIGAAAVGILLIAAVGCVFLGAGQVNDAAARSHRAQSDLVEAIRQSAPVVSNTDSVSTLEPLYFAATDGPEAGRAVAAQRYVDELKSASGRTKLPGDSMILVKGLDRAHASAMKAEGDWQAAADGLLGSAAVAVGLATRPGRTHP